MSTCEDSGAAEETQDITRRSAVVRGMYGMWAMMGAALTAPALAYLMGTPKLGKRDTEWADLGSIGNVPAGKPVEMVFERSHADGWRVASERVSAWVVRNEDDSVVAFGPQCTHLGCAYHWDEARRQFVCPCHRSLFSIEGRVLGGPAPRPLDRFEVKIEDDRLLLGELHQHPERSA
jgi:menaquinol-cytochrome c reductase iron-sulfur subunit